MVFKRLPAAAAFVCCFSLLEGAGFLTLKWDFTSQKVLTGELAVALRGESTLSPAGIRCTGNDARKPSGALLKTFRPHLTPPSAFEITAGLTLEKGYKYLSNQAMIYDAKYVALPQGAAAEKYSRGFSFFLVPCGNDFYRLAGAFGFGNESRQVMSWKVKLLPGELHKVAMRFTAGGEVIFFADGKRCGSSSLPAGALKESQLRPAFGERIGANYRPLGGTLKSVEIREIPFEPLQLLPAEGSRKVFERLEKGAVLHGLFRNALNTPLENITVKTSANSRGTAAKKLNKLLPRTTLPLEFPVETTLLPGEYQLQVDFFDKSGKRIFSKNLEYTLVPSYGDFLPVLLWGNYDNFKDLRKIGFTHQIVHLFPKQGSFTAAARKKWIPHLDANLKEGLYTFGTFHAHHRFLAARRFLRTDKEGKVYPRANLEASHPEVRLEFAEAVRSTVAGVGDHPAFDGALINSEVRDGSLPSFGSGVEPAAFKKFAGFEVPRTISGKSPMPYNGDPSFPWDRVISSKRKDLVFLRWFWDTGDGWNPLQTLLSRTMHETLKGFEHKKRFFTFYDPATRVPPRWGSGGEVDMLGQWTYTYPDPIKIGQATDELLAMAQGRPGQKIGSMTQAIWYRSKTAPAGKSVTPSPAWLKEEKEAQFISIAPDSLREAFWSKISRRLDAIMYHGVGSLVARTDHKGYRMTNLESRAVLEKLNKEVTRPLGPMLKRVPERPLEVAILESDAASFYAPRHFPAGWSKNWIADLHLALQWGHFQAGIIYDDHLLNNKNIDSLKVLFVPGLEVVTEELLAKLNELRSKGVILVGDEFTLPALMVDLRIKSVRRDEKAPAATKAQLQKLGALLAKSLEKHFSRSATASNQDIILRERGGKGADYLFILNDKRTFGNYVGQWKMVQEKGVANSGTVSVNSSAQGAYDLVNHCEIPFERKGRVCRFKVTLPPGDGKLFLLLDRKIGKAEVKLPGTIRKGEKFAVNCRMTDTRGELLAEFLPVELIMTDSAGNRLPGSGFYTTEKGLLTVNEVMAPNAASGKMKTVLRCLATGKRVEVISEVKE